MLLNGAVRNYQVPERKVPIYTVPNDKHFKNTNRIVCLTFFINFSLIAEFFCSFISSVISTNASTFAAASFQYPNSGSPQLRLGTVVNSSKSTSLPKPPSVTPIKHKLPMQLSRPPTTGSIGVSVITPAVGVTTPKELPGKLYHQQQQQQQQQIVVINHLIFSSFLTKYLELMIDCTFGWKQKSVEY